MTDPADLPAEPTLTGATTEPLLTVGGITTAVIAVLALLVAFGVPLHDAQRAAILGVVAVLAPLVTALVGRTQVYSPRSVARLLSNARGAKPLM